MYRFDFSAVTRIRYPNIVARDATDRLGDILQEHLPGRRDIVVISDARIARLYANRVVAALRKSCGGEISFITFPPGESSKSLGTAERVITSLLDKGVHRRALVIALGGGVVCDTVGFVSSIFMRGVDYLNLPTSLVAQVDAAIGGKVAVNHETCKNLIGQFWHPLAVVVDPQLLCTLPAEETRSGLAEVVKVALIYSAEFFAALENAGSPLVEEIGRDERHDTIIAQAIKAKLELLAPDPFERGDLRRALNFGHTFAHPLEVSEQFQLKHGFAVSIGMCIATAVAVERGLLPAAQGDRIFALLASLGLPTCGPPLDPELVWNNARVIRSIRANKLHYVVPVEIGRVDIVEDLTKDEFVSIYQQLQSLFSSCWSRAAQP